MKINGNTLSVINVGTFKKYFRSFVLAFIMTVESGKDILYGVSKSRPLR